jgi:hypothetical protein
MRAMLLAAAASVVGGGAYFGGAFEGGEYYEMAPAEVSEKLRYMQIPPELAQATDTGLLQFRTLSATSEAVEWDLLFNGYGIAEITANLTPSGDGTKVAIDFEVVDGALARDISGSTPLDDEFVGDIIEMGFAEQVDSYLEGRPFDEEKLGFAVAMKIAANPEKVRSLSAEMDHMAPPEDPEIYRDIAEDMAREAEAPMGDDWGN